ncbi:MAG: VWA domain-containing protein [Caldilineaceae bacterium]|nr:VWA domain-containing protein [Caldilineaceae bacterium]
MAFVLALDASATSADWAAIQSAANTAINSLRSQDSMAILTFADRPQLVEDFTSDKNALRSALSGVTPTGTNVRDLNAGAIEALEKAAQSGTGRRDVLILTGGPDTTGSATTEELLAAIRLEDVPVQVLGYGPDAQGNADLLNIAYAANGRVLLLGSAAELGANLQTLQLLMQQGYRLEYASAIQADDQPHTIVVTLVGEPDAQASSEFVATSGEVIVTTPNLTAGQTVGGAVNLTAAATSPSDIVSVVYKLDGETIAEVEDIGFSIIWDSSAVEPGAHELEVTVRDRAGNVGQSNVEFIVVKPIAVAASIDGVDSGGIAQPGAVIDIAADVDALAGVGKVDIFVDRTLLATLTAPPYRASVAADEIGPGQHTVAIVVTDSSGRQEVSTQALTVAAPPPTPRSCRGVGREHRRPGPGPGFLTGSIDGIQSPWADHYPSRFGLGADQPAAQHEPATRRKQLCRIPAFTGQYGQYCHSLRIARRGQRWIFDLLVQHQRGRITIASGGKACARGGGRRSCAGNRSQRSRGWRGGRTAAGGSARSWRRQLAEEFGRS